MSIVMKPDGTYRTVLPQVKQTKTRSIPPAPLAPIKTKDQ